MELELVSEDEMASKRGKREIKRPIEPKPKSRISVTEGEAKTYVVSKKDIEEKEERKEKEISKEEVKKIIDGVARGDIDKKGTMIVKKIYFPDGLYSVSANQRGFKKIISEGGLAWVKSMWNTHINAEGIKIISGMYAGGDKKILCIYEGENKPATFIVKITGTGGTFLINLLTFCNKIGCVVEEKNQEYADAVTLRLKEYNDINVVEPKEMGNADLDEIAKKAHEAFENKVKNWTEIKLGEWLDSYKDILISRGIDIEVAKSFRKKEIEDGIRWALENKWLT